MARYPTLSYMLGNSDLQQMYRDVQRWSSVLINELNSRDLQVDTRPSTNIYRVVTITSIGRPQKGDIAYSASTGKFKGYVSLGSETSWQDLN
tara:strand:- start:271 stop:546 length:276 start_codon:yes stop_codon:yes gene_type:complete